MRRTLFAKSAATAVLALVLIVPLSAIRAMVQERHELSGAVLQDIKHTGVDSQRVVGPILIVPYEKTTRAEVVDHTTTVKSTISTTAKAFAHFLPESLEVRASVDTETRKRGIYEVLQFGARHTLTGSFAVPERYGVQSSADATYAWEDAHVVLGIADTRGIRGTPTLRWAGRAQPWAGGTKGLPIGHGIHAALGRLPSTAQSYLFSIELDLRGTEAIEYAPVGKSTSVAMKARWPHPSFGGQFLPESRTITAQGFDATWRTSHLASGIEDVMKGALEENANAAIPTLEVSFIDPVDVYLQSERAAKYGFLFVAITFLVFFLYEVLEKLQIHPIQYGLVGVAIAMFFLLLLALGEHVPFVLAYGVAAAACVGLIGVYLSVVLKSWKRALGFSGLLGVLYGALYVLLQSEDTALLLGAALLFGILATVMIVTRKVDWYRLSAEAAEGVR